MKGFLKGEIQNGHQKRPKIPKRRYNLDSLAYFANFSDYIYCQ